MRGVRDSAPWRHPALAPVYGVVVAFLAVLLAGAVIGAKTELSVTVTGPHPDGLRVQLLDGAGQVVDSGPLDGDGWSTDVAPGDHRVCVLADAPVRLVDAQPAGRCTALPAGRKLPVTVQPVRVVVEADDAPFDKIQVVVQHPGGGPVDDPLPLDDDGRLDLPSTAPGQQVCLQLPDGWRVADDAGALRCQPVAEDPVDDVLFRLERS